jgi:hypothetical protein
MAILSVNLVDYELLTLYISQSIKRIDNLKSFDEKQNCFIFHNVQCLKISILSFPKVKYSLELAN